MVPKRLEATMAVLVIGVGLGTGNAGDDQYEDVGSGIGERMDAVSDKCEGIGYGSANYFADSKQQVEQHTY